MDEIEVAEQVGSQLEYATEAVYAKVLEFSHGTILIEMENGSRWIVRFEALNA